MDRIITSQRNGTCIHDIADYPGQRDATQTDYLYRCDIPLLISHVSDRRYREELVSLSSVVPVTMVTVQQGQGETVTSLTGLGDWNL